jgi:hypothetical protein
VDKREAFTHNGGIRTLASPEFKHDIALRVLTAVNSPTKKTAAPQRRTFPIKPLPKPKQR